MLWSTVHLIWPFLLPFMQLKCYDIRSEKGEKPTALTLGDVLALGDGETTGLTLPDALAVINGHAPEGHKGYIHTCMHTYTGAKKYLVSHQVCKFSHLKRWEACNFHHRYTSTMTDKIRIKNPEKSHCRIFYLFICKLWWKISIWSPTNKQDFWLSQTCNFLFNRLLCPPLVTCSNGTCLNLLSV